MTSERRGKARPACRRARIPSSASACARARGARGLLVLLGVGALLTAPAPALGAAPLTWRSPQPIPGSANPSAISCPSESLCVAVDLAGNVLATADPSAPLPAWGTRAGTGQSLSSVSCASESLCVAVGGHDAFVSTDGAASWSPVPADAGASLTGVSCPTVSLCVAVDEAGQVLATGSPGAPSWPAAKIDGKALRAVSCAGASACVAVDVAGQAFGSEAPAGGVWRARAIDPGFVLTAVSCSPGGPCVALDGAGDALVSADPGSSAATWSSTPIDGGGNPTAISCASSGLCVAVDEHGAAFASDDPAAALPTWSPSSPGAKLTGISCLPGGMCAAVDAGGEFLSARVPPPLVTSVAPAEVTATTATLSAVVDPHDALLGTCTFEYGTSAGYASVGYEHSAPCAALPSPAGGPQLVAATVTGLEPNTTYRYRLIAASLGGSHRGADETFTTGVSSLVPLVVPHPSIHGTPAVGSHLSCQSGTPAGAAHLTFAWLRDLIPIPRATSSAYTVNGDDSGHHLQCQVTASDAGGAVTARSAFVTIPIQGVVAAAGETMVGRARVGKRGVSIPVRCSSHASAGCRILIRLTAAGRRATLLGTARARLARGEHRTVALSLTAAGKRLVRSKRRSAAQLTVTGTVIGVIESVLAQQRLLLGASARGASSDGRAYRAH
jgi:hypothetical protein